MTIPEPILNALECVLSSDKHYVQQPIVMPCCGYAACKQCVLDNPKPLICSQCGRETAIDLSIFGESYILKCIFKSYIEELFGAVYDKMKYSISKLNDELLTFDRRLDEHIDYLKDEIEIRVATIRFELEEMSESLKSELNEIKSKIKSRCSQINLNIQQYDLDKLKAKIEKKKDLTESSFYDYQAKVTHLNSLLEDLRFIEDSITFNESKMVFDKDLIGKLNFTYLSQQNRGFLERIQTIKPDYHFVGHSPCGLFTIPSGLLVVFNNKMELYDDKFQLLKTICKTANNKNLNICSITSNNKDKLYYCEFNSHLVKTIDYSFNKTERCFINETNETNANKKLFYPYDLFYHNESIYTLDLRNKIVKLSSKHLKIEFEKNIEFQARQLRIANDILCLNTYNFDTIYFYRLPKFELINKKEKRFGPICEFNSKIYEFDKNGEAIYCYDESGNCYNEIKTKLSYVTFNNNLAITLFNSKVIISSSCGKLLTV